MAAQWTSLLLLLGASYAAPVVDDAYATHAIAALTALQTDYNATTGLWNTCGWWNAANCLTVISDLAIAYPSLKTNVDSILANTFTNAPHVNPVSAVEKVSGPGFVRTTYGTPPASDLSKRVDESAGFIDAYNDDDSWWALGWIAAYDATLNSSYLETAQGIFTYLTGKPTYCNGGIYWSPGNTYVNAIANELYLSVAAHLANRVPAPGNQEYIIAALNQWAWFQASGMINSDNTINDGLTTSCKNNNETVWSYNQGVILGALVELNRAAPNHTYLPTATRIALAAIANLTDSNNIVHDVCEPNNCGNDGPQFKGVFMRNLRMLQDAAPNARFKTVITANANSIWSFDRTNENQFGVVWSGPFVGTANCAAQSSAMDALVAAVNVAA